MLSPFYIPGNLKYVAIKFDYVDKLYRIHLISSDLNKEILERYSWWNKLIKVDDANGYFSFNKDVFSIKGKTIKIYESYNNDDSSDVYGIKDITYIFPKLIYKDDELYDDYKYKCWIWRLIGKRRKRIKRLKRGYYLYKKQPNYKLVSNKKYTVEYKYE